MLHLLVKVPECVPLDKELGVACVCLLYVHQHAVLSFALGWEEDRLAGVCACAECSADMAVCCVYNRVYHAWSFKSVCVLGLMYCTLGP